MYQLEVKRWLVTHRFHPRDGWQVHVDIDAMERAKGGQHKSDKAEIAAEAEAELRAIGAVIGAHPVYGRADVVATHPAFGTFVIEVEGDSTRQKEQAVYSALGQLVLQADGKPHQLMLAIPDEPAWEGQIQKIPPYVRKLLQLSCVLVSEDAVREDNLQLSQGPEA
ncbi:hypothetical protein [Geomonas propionica]|uniref:Uncharacterized protein n=1 Tax=Geomonas propionica TaxID=2798582 RepID=A0ABS0YQE8_9BACT|nr:hypothetical protein [Geomonas propionica]MBJ6799715.1 hypothetical protein [Geomonas propionica]